MANQKREAVFSSIVCSQVSLSELPPPAVASPAYGRPPVTERYKERKNTCNVMKPNRRRVSTFTDRRCSGGSLEDSCSTCISFNSRVSDELETPKQIQNSYL